MLDWIQLTGQNHYVSIIFFLILHTYAVSKDRKQISYKLKLFHLKGNTSLLKQLKIFYAALSTAYQGMV